MKLSRLTSKDNSLLKKIRLLASGSRRSPEGLVIAEGVRVLEEVIRADCNIEVAIISERFGATDREHHLLEAWFQKNVPIFQVNENLFTSISCVQSPQEALALVRVPPASLDRVPSVPHPLILYACGIQDPGNLGTLIRTALACGATLVCTAKGTVSARNPKAIRASAGAFFHRPPVEHLPASDFHAYCNRRFISLYRADARGGIVYTGADLKKGCAILLGNEGSGFIQEEFGSVPAIHIPMAEGIESLNVAVAGAILLFEAARQRRQH